MKLKASLILKLSAVVGDIFLNTNVTYRNIPSHAGLEVDADGVVRRMARVLKNGTMSPAKVLKRWGRDGTHVIIAKKWIKWDGLRDEAWPDVEIEDEDAVPRSSYPDGRVITVREYFAELLASRLNP